MQHYRTSPRAESPSHQQLYRRDTPSTGPRRRSSVTPSRNNFALTVVPTSGSGRRGSRTSIYTNNNNNNGGGGASPDEMVYVADVNPVYSVTASVRCFIPVNDRVLWSAEFNGALCVRALPKGTVLRTLPGREGTCCISLLHVPDVEHIWAGFQDGYVHVYNARTMELLTEVMAHAGGVNCMTQVEDTVFTGGNDWKVAQWSYDATSVQVLRTLHGHRGGVRSFGLYDGPTGAVLFSGSDDGTIRAWDPYMSGSASADSSDAANIHTFTGHRRAVLSLCVISHMNQLWSGGEDMTVRVWDMQTLECLGVLRSGHTAPIANLMLVESRIWSADKHGHILLWDITTRSLLQDLADRVPYWGIGQGMILAMQKVQPTTAYKVWTASSNGVLQCWNAETIPIVFDDVPIAAGIAPAPVSRAAAMAAETSPRRNGSATSTPRSQTGNAADVSALTVSTNNNNNNNSAMAGRADGFSGRNGPSPAQAAAAARMQEYVQRLQEELQQAQRDAKMNYEKYRVEVQLEVETQQLLAQENARLRERVQALEEMAGLPHEDDDASSSLQRRNSQAGQSGYRTQPTVAEVEAWRAEADELRAQLDDAQRQLDEALLENDRLRSTAHPPAPLPHNATEGEEEEGDHHSQEMNAVGSAEYDPARRFVRQDDLTKLPSRHDDALSDSAALSHHHLHNGGGGGAAGAPRQYSAILSTPHDTQWDSGAVARTALSRHFNGENWPYLINEKPYELHSTLIADLCAGLGVAPTQLERVDLHDGGLAVEVDVVHPSTVPSAELERRMREYRFPGLMKMHADAYTTTKIGPDTAEATIIDLQEHVAKLEEELAESTARVVEPSPEPQQPYSSSNNTLHAAPVTSPYVDAAELQRLKDANAQLRDTAADQQRRLQQLADAFQAKDDELRAAQQRAESTEAQLAEALRQLQEHHTSSAHRVRDSGDGSDLRSPRVDDSAAPPAVDGTARKKAASESGRPTELIAVPLAHEMSAAAGVSPAQVQRLEEQLEEALDKIAALEAEKNNAEQDAQQQRSQHDALSQQVQEKLQPQLAASEKQKDELQRANRSLASNVEDLKKQLADVEQALKAEKQKLAAAAAATPSALAKTPGTPQESEEVRQLREDHAALDAYLHDQLKPMISRLKRARGELQLDKDRLLERLAESEKKAEADAKQRADTPPQQTAAAASAAQQRNADATTSDPPAEDAAHIKAQLEDYEALNAYLQNQLKPMIGRLKRARGELQLDKDRLLARLAEAEKKAADAEKKAADTEKAAAVAAASAQENAAKAAPSPAVPDVKEEEVSREAAAAAKAAEVDPDAAHIQAQLEDYEALNAYLQNQLKPMISRLKRSRGELQLDKDRLLARLAEAEKAAVEAEKKAASEAPASTTQPVSADAATLSSSTPDQSPAEVKAEEEKEKSAPAADPDAALIQAELEDYAALNAYLQNQLKPMISRLKRSRGELQLDKDRLLARLAEAEKAVEAAAQAAKEESVHSPLEENADATDDASPPKNAQQINKDEESEPAAENVNDDDDADLPPIDAQLEDYDALKSYVQNQLKPMIGRLKRARGELQLDKDRLLERLAEAEMKAADAEKAAAPTSEPNPQSAEIETTAETVKSADPDAARIQAELEDYEALNAYLQNQLKPMISRLKRSRGELQLDKDRLLARLAEAEKAAADAVAAAPLAEEAPAPAQQSNDDDPASAEAAAEREAFIQAELEDYEALNNYLHEQLKPMISRLKRARGELQLDLSRTQDDLERACDMYDEAAAALEEARVREEKMGETMEALQKALEAEQRKHQHGEAAAPETSARLPSESLAGRLTEPAQLTRDGDAAAPTTTSSSVSAPHAAADGDAEDAKLHDAVDRLAAQNLDLSVRLADAETVISQLHDSLGKSSDELAHQRDETQRLLEKIQRYQQTGRGRGGDTAPSASASEH